MRSTLARAVLVCGLCAPAISHAEGTPATKVRWSYERAAGTEQCPDEAKMRDDVAARLGYDPFDDSPLSAARKVSAHIRRDGATLRATIEVIDASGAVTGSRELSSTKSDCSELASAVALTISMVIDPVGKAPTTASSPSSSAAPTPPPAAPPVVTAAPIVPPGDVPSQPSPPSAKEERPFRARVSFGAQGNVGLMPGVGYGASAAVGLAWSSASIVLEGSMIAPTTRSFGRNDATTSLLLASAVPCLHRGVLRVCGVATAGSLRGSGGRPEPMTASVLFLGAGLRAGAELPLGSGFAVYGQAEALAPLVHTTLRLEGEEVWSTAPLSGSLSGGVVAFF